MPRQLQTFVAYATGSYTIGASTVGIFNTNFGFSTAQTTAAQVAVISVYDFAIAVTYDGETDPAAKVGVPVAVGSTLKIIGAPNIQNLVFIRAQSTDAVISVILEK